ncbi:MAG: hypothetical protein ABL955_16120, partial [Elusimicrobiota bacterium]
LHRIALLRKSSQPVRHEAARRGDFLLGQLLADLRAQEETRELPVLFLSGTESVRFASQVPPEPRVRFLTKPVDMIVLVTAVREMLDPNSWSSPL